jgi:hypothetical protein
MMNFVGNIGRSLVGLGLLLLVVGALLVLSERLPWLKLGRLPGDFAVEKGGFRFYFPLATSLLVSAAVSLLFWLFHRR